MNIKQLKFIALVLIVVFSITIISAQGSSKHDVQIETWYVPRGNSEASFKSLDLKFKLATITLNDKKTSFLKLGLVFDTGEIKFKNDPIVFSNLEQFYRSGVSVTYINKWNEKWGFVGRLRPRLNSNFTDGLKADDFNIFGLASISYSKSENSRFIFGVMYANTFGSSIPLPYLSYWKRFNEKWEMNLGFPRIKLVYSVSTKEQLTGFLEFEGFSGNISKNITSSTFQQERTAERLNYRDTSVGLEYQYNFNNWMIKAKGGYTLKRKFELRDNNRDVAVEFDMKSSFFVGLGFGFNF